MPPDRWFAVGTADVSADDAGRRAAEAALIHDDAKLLIVFCSPAENLPDLIGQIRSRSGGVPLIGCTTAGEIARDGPRDGSLVVSALGGTASLPAPPLRPGRRRIFAARAPVRCAACPRRQAIPIASCCFSPMAWPAIRMRSSAARIRFSARASPWSAAARATG